jgi:hypothetical protein
MITGVGTRETAGFVASFMESTRPKIRKCLPRVRSVNTALLQCDRTVNCAVEGRFQCHFMPQPRLADLFSAR